MATAVYNNYIYVSGNPVNAADLATTKIINTDNYRINDTSKRLLSKDSGFEVKLDGALVTNYKLDYLNGIIKFDSATTGVVIISGQYLPVTRLVGCKNYSLNITAISLENTEIGQGNGGFRTRQQGLLDASLTLSRFDDMTKSEKDKLTNRESFVISIRRDTDYIKGWFIAENVNSQGGVENLEEEAMTYRLAGNSDTNLSFFSEA